LILSSIVEERKSRIRGDDESASYAAPDDTTTDILSLSTKASRQSTLGYTHGNSLSVDGAQATNLMVTQDTDKVFIQVWPPYGHNTYVLRLIVLNCVERILCDVSSRRPLPLLIYPEGTGLQAKYHIWYNIL